MLLHASKGDIDSDSDSVKEKEKDNDRDRDSDSVRDKEKENIHTAHNTHGTQKAEGFLVFCSDLNTYVFSGAFDKTSGLCYTIDNKDVIPLEIRHENLIGMFE